ncbi:MAG: SUMF1/EgtB/PvdO family nonheme iron enzyme [Myxococcales bacterium]|nr:SUMF1/EgtB/PvdO family nonheme iron enzyme [Myxococcales bacterium]
MENDPLSLVGTTIAEKYLVESVVGEGGFAVVYRALHTVWKRPVAIKVFKALSEVSRARRQELLDDFIREGALLAELSERSSAIVQARDVGMVALPQGDSVPYMVLEWLEGEPLETLLLRERELGTPPRMPEEVVALLGPVANALALAHQKGIAHRDVKPGNIFVVATDDGVAQVKLLDFGIAKVVQEAQKDGFRKTAGGMTSFTPLYGAPEQFDRGRGATGPWTDVFAFALILVELLAGREALVGDDLAQLAYSSMDERRRPTPRELGVEVSDEVEAVFAKALAVRPEDRYGDAGLMWSALRGALSMGPASGLAATMPTGTTVRSVRSPVVQDPTEHTLSSNDRTLAAAVAVPSGPTEGPSGGALPSSRTLTADPTPPAPSRKGLVWGGVAAVALLGLAAFGVSRMRSVDPAPSTPAASTTIASATPTPSVAPSAAPACPKGMLRVDGGEFFMGSDDKKTNEDERPAHPVKLSAYCLDEFEVTTAEYKACSDAGKCKRLDPSSNEWKGITARQRKLYDPVCNANDYAGRGSHPINCVDFEQAETFCREVRGGRLPTEAEWEFAARGSDGRVYPWGDALPAPGLLNACGAECVAWGKKNPDPDGYFVAMYKSDDGFVHTSPVGSFPRGQTSHGMKDMVGNVWEWVSDYYGPYASGPKVVDPKGPDKGEERVIRGGAWNGGDPAWLRPSFRYQAPATMRSHGIGFRCAKSG